ncbi:RNA polymerase sigma factor [Luteolibacter soli]|uniref:Sigma-70 family RNA polymerase sigma factor n=1 Tax=Luteolibacter soli TaxID=3135280 RepID=A0ABU9ARY2_9BACT
MDLAVPEIDAIANGDSEQAPLLLTLTAGLARGDDAAWREFFDAYEGRLMAYIRTCQAGNPEGVDDVYQETMLRVMRHARPFSDEAAFWSWLTVIARSAITDHWRKRSAWRRFLDRFVSDRSRAPAERGRSDDGFERALAGMDDGMRKLLERKYDEKWSVRRLADAENVSEKVLEHRLAKARLELGRAMRRIGEEDAS